MLSEKVVVKNMETFPVKELWKNHYTDVSLHMTCWFGIAFTTAIATWFPLYLDEYLKFDEGTYHLIIILMAIIGSLAFIGSSIIVQYASTTSYLLFSFIACLVTLIPFCIFVSLKFNRWVII